MSRKFIFGGSFLSIPSLDPDAVAFLTAAAITDPTITSAIDTLVVQLKADGIWIKMKALYPFVGGTASTHKFNLKNPLDTDAAFRLVFFGGVTHDSNGITGNATNAYANTFLQNNLVLNENNKHISIYQRNILPNPSGASFGIGNNNRFYLNFGGSNFSTLGMNQSPFAIISPQNGMFLMSKTLSNSYKYYQNALLPLTRTGTDQVGLYNYLILANTTNGINRVDYSNANLSLVSIGESFSDTDAANYYTAVQAFQTTLGRQV
jgi:hypothetical protein